MKNWVKIFFSVLIFIASICYMLFSVNKANIYAGIGKYYIKKGNYISAQQFYEKSYLFGNTNSDFRENYVNLLINSPLNIDAQSMLVNIAEDSIKDNASESAKYFLHNLKREIQNKYKDNYIQQAPYNNQIIHWGKIPITYTFKHTKNVPDEIIKAVNDAFDAWERASSVRIRFDRVNVNADIVVNFTANKIKDPKLEQKYIIAYTMPDISQNKLNRMDMILNTINVDGKPFTPNQIYNTALHEIFHALGFMGHSFNKDDIMYMSSNVFSVVNDTRQDLSPADKTTLELLYKIKPDVTNVNELRYEYISYLIVGNSADVNYAKANEAKSYIRKAPRVPAGYIDLAQTYINEKDYTSAVICLEKALNLSTNDDTKFLALYNLAVTYYLDKSYPMALFYIDKAKEIKDENDLHFLAAESYLKQKDTKNAIKEYSYLVSKNPNNIEYTINLANIYISNHNYLKARKVLKTFLKHNPDEKNNPVFKPCRILLF